MTSDFFGRDMNKENALHFYSKVNICLHYFYNYV